MKELMLRLIKDGKIVGYEWHRHVETETGITVWYKHVDDDEKWHYNGKLEIDYDSFYIGIKVGDEWWFENDIDDKNRILKYGRFVYNSMVANGTDMICYGWYWDNGKSVYPFYCAGERIGTVYDKDIVYEFEKSIMIHELKKSIMSELMDRSHDFPLNSPDEICSIIDPIIENI